MRETLFINDEFYHVYNRGVDKRIIFSDDYDVERFLQSMDEFNTLEPIGSIYENSFVKNRAKNTKSSSDQDHLVEFVAYCINPNHFHFILKQVADGGISRFMKSLGGGYAKYFNEKHKRSGTLFQGRFRAIHVDSNDYLLHLSSYVNLNDRVHKLGNPTSKLVKSRSSWGEYLGNEENFCFKDIILDQFKDSKDYKSFAGKSLEGILINRGKLDGVDKLLLE